MDGIRQGADAVFGPLGVIEAGVMAVLLILALVAFAVAFHFLLRRPERRDAEALAALAARRGWTIERRMATLGMGYHVAVAPQDGAGWSCLVTRYINVGRGGAVRATAFEDPAIRLPAGLVVIGPGLPDAERKAAAALLGTLGGGLQRMMAVKVLGEELAAQAPGLRLVEAACFPGATAFATEAAPAAAMAAACAPLLEAWRKAHPKAEAFPILILGTHGLRIRLRTDASTEPLLSAFLDLALTVRSRVAALLGGGAV